MVLWLVKKPITCLEYCAETKLKINNGSAIPTAKAKNPNRFWMNEVTDVESAKRITSDAGLQGSTMIPKKIPKSNEVR